MPRLLSRPPRRPPGRRARCPRSCSCSGPSCAPKERTHHQPALLVLQDASQSIGEDEPDWATTLDAWMASLPPRKDSPERPTSPYGFGSELAKVVHEGDTVWMPHHQSLHRRWTRCRDNGPDGPIGAVVIATDGRFNRGRDPESAGFPSALPSTSSPSGHHAAKGRPHRPALAQRHRRTGQPIPHRSGNRKPSRDRHRRHPHRKRDVGWWRTVEPRTRVEPRPATFLVEANRPGIQRYTVTGRRGGRRNQPRQQPPTITVDVIERKKRILFTGTCPHPDRGAWANALSANANYEVVQQQRVRPERQPIPRRRALGRLSCSSASIRATCQPGRIQKPPARQLAHGHRPRPRCRLSAPWPTSASDWMSALPERD